MRIVFDFGGVLFRWRPAELLRRELPAHAVDASSTARLVDGIFQGYGDDWGEFDRGTIQAAPLAERIAARTGLTTAEVRRVIDGVPDELAPIDASVALLAQLRAAGRRLHYLSNMPAPYADHLERTHDFVGWFESGVFSARVGLVKPERAIFEHAQALYGAAPQELLFLDDHLPNVQAARDAGWQALHYSDAARCAAELRALGLLSPAPFQGEGP